MGGNGKGRGKLTEVGGVRRRSDRIAADFLSFFFFLVFFCFFLLLCEGLLLAAFCCCEDVGRQGGLIMNGWSEDQLRKCASHSPFE
jgi:hypothetical protein